MTGQETPEPRTGAPEGDSLTAPILRPQIAYCGTCGHDEPRHRHGRCWTDALGNPLARSRSLIACMCDRFEVPS